MVKRFINILVKDLYNSFYTIVKDFYLIMQPMQQALTVIAQI